MIHQEKNDIYYVQHTVMKGVNIYMMIPLIRVPNFAMIL